MSTRLWVALFKAIQRQERVPIPQSKDYREEYKKRELAILFSFWSVFILTRYCYWRAVIALSDHPRWMFRKNSMEFFVVLSYYLYYFTVAILLRVQNHMFFQNILWSPDLVMWYDYLSSHAYLYLHPIVCLEVIDQIFKCTGSYFLLRALITDIVTMLQCDNTTYN